MLETSSRISTPPGPDARWRTSFDTRSLPIISHSLHHANVLFFFSHFGLTMGAIGGRLIVEMAAGRPTTIYITPYRVNCF
jgi:glycine/D-amino acid oxidase-like deaminating enzyme